MILFRASGRSCAPRLAAAALALAALAVSSPPAAAQHLPITQYTVADGLAHNVVDVILQDSRGYLWFGTNEGLNRFDGYRFTTYGVEDGLPHPFVVDLTEDAHGGLWVATLQGGLARFVDTPVPAMGAPALSVVQVDREPDANTVRAVVADRAGALWCVTMAGIYRGETDDAGAVTFTRQLATPRASGGAAFVDPAGHVYLASERDVYLVSSRGLVRVGGAADVGRFPVAAITELADGRLVVANSYELYVAVGRDEAGRPAGWRRLSLSSGESGPGPELRKVAVDSTGRLWVTTSRGLIWWRDGQPSAPDLGEAFEGPLNGLLHDRDNNVWVGTSRQGVLRVSPGPIASVRAADGLPSQNVFRVVEALDGTLYVSTDGGVVRLDHGHVAPVPGAARFGSVGARIVQDGQGSWWLSRQDGTAYWAPAGPLNLTRARAVFHGTPTGGWPAPMVGADATGGWIGGPDRLLLRATVAGGRPRLDREPLSGRLDFDVGRMMRDRAGWLWLAGYGGFARAHDGPAEPISTGILRDPLVRALFADSRGWQWVGLRYHGVILTKTPSASRPVFEQYSVKDGLGSNTVWAITEDRGGRMYFGTGRGLDVLDVGTGEIRQTTVADGLAGAPVTSLLTDRQGRIWISTPSGLSVLEPEAPRAAPRDPPVYVTRLQIEGADQPLPGRGAAAAGPLTLASNRNTISVEFVGLSFRAGPAPRYQYRLEPTQTDWSAPTPQRQVTYAQLAPGEYRFAVRAVADDGAVSAAPATVAFTVLAPLWRRWWFLTLGALAILGAGAALNQMRTRQVLALERVRRQVAFDLHDDIGSGLSQIAILSEVGREEDPAVVADLWGEVGTLARALRESMSDIVWAVDPRHDRLADLVQRMKQVAFNLLEADGVTVAFEAPAPAELERLALAPDRRRHVLLIFKEAVHNVTKHAAASSVRLVVELESGTLRVAIEDDGRGFEPAAKYEGHGLDSLRRRARELDAELQITARPGAGTAVRLTVPIGPRRRPPARLGGLSGRRSAEDNGVAPAQRTRP